MSHCKQCTYKATWRVLSAIQVLTMTIIAYSVSLFERYYIFYSRSCWAKHWQSQLCNCNPDLVTTVPTCISRQQCLAAPEVLTANGTTATDFHLATNQIMNPCYHFSNIFVSRLSIFSGQALNTYKRQLTSHWIMGETPSNTVKGYLDGTLVNRGVCSCLYLRETLSLGFVSQSFAIKGHFQVGHHTDNKTGMNSIYDLNDGMHWPYVRLYLLNKYYKPVSGTVLKPWTQPHSLDYLQIFKQELRRCDKKK